MVTPLRSCMFNTITCGTVSCFPESIGGKVVMNGQDKMEIVEPHFLWVCRPSPIPCFNGCGVGPCAQRAAFKKESDTVFVGTGEAAHGPSSLRAYRGNPVCISSLLSYFSYALSVCARHR